MDQVTSIRHAVLVLGRSRRWAAKTYGVARNTVDRYLDGAEPGKRKPAARSSPKRTEVEAALAVVVAETAVTKKQQLTARRAHELLTSKGVDVGYSLVKEAMAARRKAAKEVFPPLVYPPGDLVEVDFFEVEVDLRGVRTTVWMFLMRLMFSGRDFAWLYPRQDQVCFLDGHVRAFAHFGAVPERAAYDNLKAAVAKILVGSERDLQPRFKALTKHYTLEACFCRPYEGHDKGGVESRGKNVRLQSLVPVPSGETLDEISERLLADIDRRRLARDDAAAQAALELAGMHAAPKRAFDARRTDPACGVSAQATVVVEGATYSVPESWARTTVVSHAGVHEIALVNANGEVCRRERVPRGEKDIDYAAHYLETLSKKPQALRQVSTVLMPQLGDPFPEWWTLFVDEYGARDAARQMARILRGVLQLGRDEAVLRVRGALERNEPVSIALLPPTKSAGVAGVVPKALDFEVEASSVASFDALLTMPGGVA